MRSAAASDGAGTAARRGVRWGALSQAATQGLSLLATLVMARLLDAEDYGVVAFAQSVVGFMAVLTTWGFGTALVRAKQPSRQEVNGAFWAAVLVGGLLMGLAGVAAILVPYVFTDDRTAGAVLLLAPTLLVNTMATVPSGLMQRRMNFGRLYISQMAGTLVYVAVELFLAWRGLGPWSVVIGLLAGSVVTLTSAWRLAALSVGRANPLRWLRSERGFAGGLMAIQGATSLNKNADYWFVGAILGPAALGQYYIAFVLPSILRLRLSWILGTVLLPVFARTEPGSPELREAYRRSTVLQMGVGIPMLIGLAVVAQPLIVLAMGSKWLEAADVVGILAAATVLDLLGVAPQRLAIAHGRLRPAVLCEVGGFVTFVIVAGALLSIERAPESIALAVVAGRLTVFASAMRWVARPLGVGVHLVRRPLVAISIATGVMALSAWTLQTEPASGDWPPAAELAVAVIGGALAYVTALRLAFPSMFRALRADLHLIATGR